MANLPDWEVSFWQLDCCQHPVSIFQQTHTGNVSIRPFKKEGTAVFPLVVLSEESKFDQIRFLLRIESATPILRESA